LLVRGDMFVPFFLFSVTIPDMFEKKGHRKRQKNTGKDLEYAHTFSPFSRKLRAETTYFFCETYFSWAALREYSFFF
jgi:hypothetical protein